MLLVNLNHQPMHHMETPTTVVGEITQTSPGSRSPPQYTPPAPPQYASTSQPSQPQLTSPIEQAILNLSKVVGNFIEEQKAINVQANQRIDTMESTLNKRLDGFQSEIAQKFYNLEHSISKLTNQQQV